MDNATVGRIVHYTDRHDTRPHAAVVIASGENTVDLRVFQPDGDDYLVFFVFQSREPGEPGYWNYPPRV